MFLSLNSKSKSPMGHGSHLPHSRSTSHHQHPDSHTAEQPGRTFPEDHQVCFQWELNHQKNWGRRSSWPLTPLLSCPLICFSVEWPSSRGPFQKWQRFPQQLWGHLVQCFNQCHCSWVWLSWPSSHRHPLPPLLRPLLLHSQAPILYWIVDGNTLLDLFEIDPVENEVEGNILRIYAVETKPWQQ